MVRDLDSDMEAVVCKLRAALKDLQEFDGGLRFYLELNATERSSFRAAYGRLQSQAVWLRETVKALTGERTAHVNGTDVDPLTFALDSGMHPGGADLLDHRLHASGIFENMISRAIGEAQRQMEGGSASARQEVTAGERVPRLQGAAPQEDRNFSRITTKELQDFESQLRALHQLLNEIRWDGPLARSTPTGHELARGKAEILRQSIVRRSGRYMLLVDRLNGGPVAVSRSPAAGGGVLGPLWQVALAADNGYGPPFGLDQLANRVAMAAGMLDADPSLADPLEPRQRTSGDPKMSSFERDRQTMVEKLLELRGICGYANPKTLSPLLGRALIDIADDAWTLKRQGYVTILEVGDQAGPEGGDRPGILDIRLTELGVQRAKEGYQAVAAQTSLQQTNNNTFLTTGGTLNVAQTGRGDVFQRIEQASDVGEIRRLLGELRQAIAGAEHLADADREAGLVYVEQLVSELQQPKPRPSMLKIPWTALGKIADVAGAAQGGLMVVEAYRQLAPLIAPLLAAAGG